MHKKVILKNGLFGFSTLLNPGINYTILAERITELTHTLESDEMTTIYSDSLESAVPVIIETEPVEIFTNLTKKDTVIKAEPVAIHGIVKGSDTFSPMGGTHLLLLNEEYNIKESYTLSDGRFEFEIFPDKDYFITATRKGFFQAELEIL